MPQDIDPISQLPDDAQLLKQQLRASASEVQRLKLMVDKLKLQLARRTRAQFGVSSERFDLQASLIDPIALEQLPVRKPRQPPMPAASTAACPLTCLASNTRFVPQPLEPNQNAYIERFNRTYRHEVLDAYVFKSIDQVQDITEEWLRVYNEQRPHDALNGLPPKQCLLRLNTAADSSNRLST